MIDWNQARDAMCLDRTVANLNTGSFGPWPKPVFERVTALRRRLAEEPMDFLLRESPPLIWEARRRLAEFLAGDPRRLLFTANVSVAINIVASGLTIASPGEILLTDHEYGAMHWCWERAAQRQGLVLRTFPLPVRTEDPEEIVAAFVAAIGPKTRLAFFSHVLSPTGLVLPVKRMCEEARRRGVTTVVDGAHAPSMVPVDLEAIGADFYAANCHKWLLAPTGTGFLYFGKGSEERLQPMQVSWGYRPDRSKWNEPDAFGTTARLRFYEFEGTRDLCPWMTIPEAVDFQAALGWQNIRERNLSLANYVRDRIREMFPQLTPWTPRHPELHGFLTAFRLPPGVDAVAWRKALWETWRIEIPIVERPDCLLIRVSTHFYNTQAEIDHWIAALRTLLIS
ncbi:MAG: aminotransferase class V-fold PLP-dependent enzyme [Gemmataceae bacterium]